MVHRTPKKKNEVSKKDIAELKRKVKNLEIQINKMQKEFAEIITEPRKVIYEAFGLTPPEEIGSEYEKIKERLKHANREKRE